MRILHIMAGKSVGGAETYSTDMMLSLHEAGVTQAVVMHECAPRFAEMKGAGLRLFPEVFRWPLRFFQKRQLKALIEREDPDIIHCWMRRAASILPDVSFLQGKRHRVVIGWFGGYYEPRYFDMCNQFVGVTQDIAAHMVRKGVPENRAHYIQTFPDIVQMEAVKRSALNTPDDAVVLLTLARLHPKKGLDVMLKALALLPSNVYLWMAGDGPLRDELRKQCHDLGLDERVRFLGWRTDRSALLAGADICVFPSRYEPFGTVTLEAWAAQRPLVACRSAGPAATITHGKDGLLVDIDDVKGLANSIQTLVQNKELAAELVVGGKKRYEQDFTRAAVTKKMMDFYQEALRENGK